ncbi:MAG: hypothetical protein QOG62_384 [Thermoleophilaceae bacterium]|nr:hypothetical protein [Thermoleophilaceae bacterium]
MARLIKLRDRMTRPISIAVLALALVAALGALTVPNAGAAGIKFAPGHYTGTLDNGGGTISFRAKAGKTLAIKGGRLHYAVPAGSVCTPSTTLGTFTGDPSFKAALNSKGFFSVSGHSVDPQFGDTLDLTIQGRVRKNGTTSGKVIANEVFQVGGTITELTQCKFESRFTGALG